MHAFARQRKTWVVVVVEGPQVPCLPEERWKAAVERRDVNILLWLRLRVFDYKIWLFFFFKFFCRFQVLMER